MDCLPSFDWSRLQWLVPPLVTATGIGVSFWLAVSQPHRQRRAERRLYAIAAGEVLEEALYRVHDRIEIRVDPGSYERTGRKMRQSRAEAAVRMLASLKLESLPVEFVSAFGRASGNLQALNEAMSNEKVWPPPQEEIGRYKVAYGLALEAISSFNEQSAKISLRQISPPGAASGRSNS